MKRVLQISQPVEPVEALIRVIRGQRVILDADLARVYGVSTKVLNQAVKRNQQRFPSDFMFQLTLEEVADMRSQITPALEQGNRSQIVTGSEVAMRSQFVTASEQVNPSQTATGSQKHRDPRFSPYVFTEYGAFQAANVLNSKQAVQMGVFVVRAFVKMRVALVAHRELAVKLAELERSLVARLDTHDQLITGIIKELHRLASPPPPPPTKNGL